MNQKSEQITRNGKLELANDIKLSKKETKEILLNIFGTNLKEEIIANRKVFTVDYGKKKTVLLTAQISYLGNPHPIYKKRVQLKQWYMEVINAKKYDLKYEIKLIGIYRYKDNVVFVDFDKTTYVNKKMHNSSAHVYSNDLYKAMQYGHFEKLDYFDNKILVLDRLNFKKYIVDICNESLTIFEDSDEQKLIKIIDNFNKNGMIFNTWIEVQNAIKEMKENKFKKWKECEWAGFYLEYKFWDYTFKSHMENYVKYLNNDSKEEGLDFDLKFPRLNFFGDLKSSSENEITTMLNDADNIEMELNQYERLWYLIYEHETVKDKDLENNPYTKKRLEYIRVFEPNYKKGKDDTYSSRLKAKVKYKRMFIVEINKFNYKNMLEKMTSNFHQPNHGEVRKPKFKLTKQNIQNAIIYCYNPTVGNEEKEETVQ